MQLILAAAPGALATGDGRRALTIIAVTALFCRLALIGTSGEH